MGSMDFSNALSPPFCNQVPYQDFTYLSGWALGPDGASTLYRANG